MTILLYKDGKLIVDAEQPLEGVSLDNLAAILSGASDGDVIQYDETNGMWVNKSAPSSLPEVTASDKGKYLKANESTGDPEWASGGSSGGGVLVVKVTDTADGAACDKTAAEMFSAFTAGVVVFDATSGGYGTLSTCASAGHYEGEGYRFIDTTGEYEFLAENGTDYPASVNPK